MPRSRFFRALAALCAAITLASAPALAGEPIVKDLSPDGRFALRIIESKQDGTPPTVEIIERKSGKVAGALATEYFEATHNSLLWSADSKRVAFATHGQKEGEVSVLFWNAATSKFEDVELPEELPIPDIKFPKNDNGSVKNYGGTPKPVRWLKSGDLLMSKDSIMMSRDSGATYTGTITFTFVFDKARHATIHSVSKTKTTVDK
jgi:hypothetical protein